MRAAVACGAGLGWPPFSDEAEVGPLLIFGGVWPRGGRLVSVESGHVFFFVVCVSVLYFLHTPLWNFFEVGYVALLVSWGYAGLRSNHGCEAG